MNYDNPADRLLSILEEGCTQPKNNPCLHTWGVLLKCPNNSSLLMQKLGKVMELPRLAVNAITESFPDQVTTTRHWVNQIDSAFTRQNFHANWDSFINHIDSHTISYLSLSATLLSQKSNTKLIDEADLVSVRESLDKLLSDVIESSIDGEVKKFLVHALRKLIEGIDDYRITGAVSLLESIAATLGYAFLDKHYKTFLSDSELGKRLLDTLTAMANVVTVAVGLPQLTQAIALLSS